MTESLLILLQGEPQLLGVADFGRVHPQVARITKRAREVQAPVLAHVIGRGVGVGDDAGVGLCRWSQVDIVAAVLSVEPYLPEVDGAA